MFFLLLGLKTDEQVTHTHTHSTARASLLSASCPTSEFGVTAVAALIVHHTGSKKP